jgi:undecaprenyl-phosphate 4-deoxy-4-formamido-L-arabinose transferase
MHSPSVSIVVPVYNSETTLIELVRRLTEALEPSTSCFEILLVNDGSYDSCWTEICKMAAQDPRVKGIDLMRNFGQYNAVLAGVRAANYDIIVTLDDDLQHPPESIPTLLAALDEDDGCDLVYGVPAQLHHSRWRNAATVAAKEVLETAFGWPDATGITDFRAFRASLREGFANFNAPTVVFDALLAWSTTSIKRVPVQHAPRAVGHSNYRLSSLLDYAALSVTAVSIRPLRLVTATGVLTLVAGLLSITGVLIYQLATGEAALTLALLLCVLISLAGMQILAVGVVGEYIARSHQRLLDKSTYVIRRTTRDSAEDQ